MEWFRTCRIAYGMLDEYEMASQMAGDICDTAMGYVSGDISGMWPHPKRMAQLRKGMLGRKRAEFSRVVCPIICTSVVP